MITSGLRFGPLGKHTVHVAIDMQVVFAENSEWATPATLEIAPQVARIAAHAPQRTIFTRFLTPRSAHEVPGQWQNYYRRWASVLADRNDPAIYDLLPVLKPFVPPARVVDKYAHSAFEAASFKPTLDALLADTLVLTGVETDVCVLATAMTAIDRGLRTILVGDALASSSRQGHESAMTAIYPHFDQQVETIDTATLLEEWKP
ncbi:MAG: cysteine hydrolase [Hyphomicrobiales bacterium]